MIDESSIKGAFSKVKEDIFNLGNEFFHLKDELSDIKNQINLLNDSIDKLKTELISPTDTPTHLNENPAIPAIPTDTPTVPVEIRGLKYPNLDSSSGNVGVPTDRQTNQQTDNSLSKPPMKPLVTHIKDAQDILDSLDAIKKEIRLKFKQITNQEMIVFSTIYALEEQLPEGVEYRQIAEKLKLSESSIRDYTQKLISKGIPLDKIKLNNKKILLKISPKLKNIASLDILIRLREL